MVNMTALTQTWSIPSAGLSFNTGVADANGCQWTTIEEKGWHGGAAPRNNRTAKPSSQGTYRIPSYRDARVVSFTGWVSCPTYAARNGAARQLAALMTDPNTLYQIICTEELGSVYINAELDTDVQVSPKTGFDLLFTLQVAAPDPRKYATAVQSASTSLPLSTGGLDWVTGGGLDWVTGGGLNWGTVVSTGQLIASNTGTAGTWPTFTLTAGANPLQFPTITNIGTGNQFFYNGVLNAGDVLVINSNPFSQSVTLNGSADRRAFLSTAQWFELGANSISTITFSAAVYSSTAILSASWNPAFW